MEDIHLISVIQDKKMVIIFILFKNLILLFKGGFVRLNFTDEILENVSQNYANKCVCLYWIILHYTKMGKSGHQFKFSDFVIATLSHMQSGLAIDSRLFSYPITLIEPHKLLQARNFDRILKLPDSIIPNFLHGHKRSIEQTKLSIEQALQSSIVDDGVAPQLLKMDSITVDDVPEFFVK